jgi:hypothetical protein
MVSPAAVPFVAATPPVSNKRASSVLVSSPSIKQSEAVAKQKALVTQLKIDMVQVGLTDDQTHAARSAVAFAEQELYNMTGEVAEVVVVPEEPKPKKQKTGKEVSKEGTGVLRCGNTGSFSALEDAMGINSNEALDDGKKLSKKDQRIADAEDAAEEDERGEEDADEE